MWPGESIELKVPWELSEDISIAVEPRSDSKLTTSNDTACMWPTPTITHTVAGHLRLVNDTDDPQLLRRNDHFCQILPVTSPADTGPAASHFTSAPRSSSQVQKYHSDSICLDPDSQFSPAMRNKFQDLHREFDAVFDPVIVGYNGACGPLEAVVNMGPVQPPQRKGRLPQYSRDKLLELQSKFDELESVGVFHRPEDAGVTVEYLNPSFLVKKANGGYRLVTAFSDVGRYSKPQPSLMPDVESTLRTIGRWRYIIVSDMTSAFYQIPVSKSSMKYCGVATPFKGIRLYARCAMGMPGSETALEELTCRVLGDLHQEGIVAKLADDLYCGGDTEDELLHNWRRVLSALDKCSLRLSTKKTIVNPKSTGILGWIWTQGTLEASPHRIAVLSACVPPTTVRELRSYIGAYRVLSRVITRCAELLAALENTVAGRTSLEKLVWSDEMRDAFKQAQSALSSSQTIVLPRPSDQLWISTDASVKQRGIGATLYVSRSDILKLAGFYSAKLKKKQINWLPCEVEALAIAAAVKHFAPYIIQSTVQTCVLTDSKPCVQAFQKLCRGEFSNSPRVSTYLSTASHFQVDIRHLAGNANVPSDFSSRNAPDCDNPNCQICSFIQQAECAVVSTVSVQDIVAGNSRLPVANRATWISAQRDCPDL